MTAPEKPQRGKKVVEKPVDTPTTDDVTVTTSPEQVLAGVDSTPEPTETVVESVVVDTTPVPDIWQTIAVLTDESGITRTTSILDLGVGTLISVTAQKDGTLSQSLQYCYGVKAHTLKKT